MPPIPKPVKRKQSKRGSKREGMDPKYLAYLRTLPCVCCGSPLTEAHHLLSMGGRGAGLKEVDMLSIPLCRADHAALHNNGAKNEREFLKRNGVDIEATLKLLHNRYACLKPPSRIDWPELTDPKENDDA